MARLYAWTVEPLELPGWSITVEEVAPGVYKLNARDTAGRTFEATDPEIDRAFEGLKRYAARWSSPEAS